jgi:hypothetical protein
MKMFETSDERQVKSNSGDTAKFDGTTKLIQKDEQQRRHNGQKKE